MHPWLHNNIIARIADTWRTDERVAELVEKVKELDLTILHAVDDYEIPWREGRGIWDAAMRPLRLDGAGAGAAAAAVADTEESATYDWLGKHLTWKRLVAGGHNKVAASQEAALAVARVLQR